MGFLFELILIPLALLGLFIDVVFDSGLFGLAIDGFIIYSIVKAIKKGKEKKKNKEKSKKNTKDVKEEKLLNNLKKYFATNQLLYIDDNTYIQPDDYKNIQLGNLSIYMNGEQISSLTEYRLAFPNAYNTFISLINDYLSHKKTVPHFTPKTEVNNTVTPKQTSEEAKAPVSDEKKKDAAYYIEKLDELNVAITEEKITEGLHQSVKYLNQIKKIEDEFPECKDKTGKLYQYYLPMMTDILENYKRLSINANNHSEFKASEDRLLKTVMLINGALDTISTTLCEDYYTDMSADMKTLEALLKKDGYGNENTMDFDSLRKGVGE